MRPFCSWFSKQKPVFGTEAHTHKPLSGNASNWASEFGRNRNQRLLCRDPDIAKDCQEDLLQQLYPYNSFTRETGKEAHESERTKCLPLSLRRTLTCEQLAMVLVGKPMDGAQATSRTQSLWASSFCSSFHWLSSSLKTQLYSWKGSGSVSHPLLGKALDCSFQTLYCSSRQYKAQAFPTSSKISMAWTDKIPSRGHKAAQAKRFWPSVTVRNLLLPKWQRYPKTIRKPPLETRSHRAGINCKNHGRYCASLSFHFQNTSLKQSFKDDTIGMLKILLEILTGTLKA